MEIKDTNVLVWNHTNEKQPPEPQQESLSFTQDIHIENYGTFNYFFANDLTLIQDEIYRLTGNKIISVIDDCDWESNPHLAENVKTAMDKLNVNFSMT